MNDMPDNPAPHGPYHRIGSPGGPGCPVSTLPITWKGPDGTFVQGHLLDAGADATELELLRTIAEKFGVRWGHDDLGWWAVVK